MSICILCICDVSKTTSYGISFKIYENFTIEDAIQEYFQCSEFILSSHQKVVCTTCMRLLLTFHEFAVKVNDFYIGNSDCSTYKRSQIPSQSEVVSQKLTKNNSYSVDQIEDDIIECFDDEIEGNFEGSSEYIEPESEENQVQKDFLDSTSKNEAQNEDFAEESASADNILQNFKPQIFLKFSNSIKVVKIPKDSNQKFFVAKSNRNFDKPTKSEGLCPYLSSKEENYEETISNRGNTASDALQNCNQERVQLSKFPRTSNSISFNQTIENFTCYACKEDFKSFLKLTQHFKVLHASQKPFVICCNKKFIRRSAFAAHMKVHENPHNCSTCNKEFESSLELKSHVKKFHNKSQKYFSCTKCGNTYSNKYILKTHIAKHMEEEKSYECYKCKKSLKNYPRLLHHFKYKHDPAYNSSSICHICSKTVTRLDIHMRQMHSTDSTERIKCDICGHWMKKSSLKGHMAGHKEVGRNCEKCGKFLKNRNSYFCHMKRVHSTGKFKCEHCDKTFHHESRLMDHVACQHTGEFIHRCRIDGCKKMFRNAHRRRIHERRIHPNEYEKSFKAAYLRENICEENDDN